jgi:hypothetical protein
VDLVAAVVADEQPLDVVEPGEAALDDPAGATQARAVLGLAAGDRRLDPSAPERSPVLVVVVAAVGDKTRGPAPRSADPPAHRRHAVEQREKLRDVVAIAARERPGQRDAADPLRGGGACCRGGPGRPGSDPSASPLFRLHVTRIGDRARPIELVAACSVGQQQLVQALPDAGLLPGAQPPPRRHPATEAEFPRQMCSQRSPYAARTGSLARRAGHSAAFGRIAKAALRPRQQRLNPLPQPIGDNPRRYPHRHPPPSLRTDADDFAARSRVRSLS